jgi:hypothetical protein
MEDLEGYMQHGVATLHYTHKVVTKVPHIALIPKGTELQLLF